MVVVGSKHFYVFEFARLGTGEYVVPERWVKYKSEMHGEVFRVITGDDGLGSIDDSTTVRVKVTDFCDTFLDLQEHGTIPQCNGKAFSTCEDTLADPCPRNIDSEICEHNAQSRSDPRRW